MIHQLLFKLQWEAEWVRHNLAWNSGCWPSRTGYSNSRGPRTLQLLSQSKFLGSRLADNHAKRPPWSESRRHLWLLLHKGIKWNLQIQPKFLTISRARPGYEILDDEKHFPSTPCCIQISIILTSPLQEGWGRLAMWFLLQDVTKGQFLAKVTLAGRPWTLALIPSSVTVGICQESSNPPELLSPRENFGKHSTASVSASQWE